MTLPQEVRAWPSHHPSIILIITPSSNFNVRNVGCVRNLVLQMQGAERPSRVPLTLFTLNTPEAIKEYAFGCDADVGGTSTVHFDFDDHPARAPPDPITTKTTGTGTGTGAGADAGGNRKRGAARFHGEMRLGVRPGYEDRIRGGYAGFRNKVSAIRRYVKLQKKTLILFFFSFFKKKKSSARRCLASSQTTYQITDFSLCACVWRATRVRTARTSSTSKRRARQTTICGSTACTLRVTMVDGKISLCAHFFPHSTHHNRHYPVIFLGCLFIKISYVD